MQTEIKNVLLLFKSSWLNPAFYFAESPTRAEYIYVKQAYDTVFLSLCTLTNTCLRSSCFAEQLQKALPKKPVSIIHKSLYKLPGQYFSHSVLFSAGNIQVNVTFYNIYP